METMEKSSFETPKTFVPTETQYDILRAVADKQGCHISHVVHALHPAWSENSVRSGVRVLLSRGCLDGGKSSSEVLLRLTSRGRLLLQQPVDDGHQPLRDVRVDFADRAGRVFADSVDGTGGGFRSKWRATHAHGVQDATQAEQVAAVIQRRPAGA